VKCAHRGRTGEVMGRKLTTAEAERKSGATRWRLMRAQKAGDLVGYRDNKNRWLWDEESLVEWCAQSAHNVRAQLKHKEETDTYKPLLEAVERAARAEGEVIGMKLALEEVRLRAEKAESELERLRARRWWQIGKK